MSRCFALAQVPAALPQILLRNRALGQADQAKRVKWSEHEDKILTATIQRHGVDWAVVAMALPGRTGKQCRERWTNQLNPSLSRENWTATEDSVLRAQQQRFGNAWAKITAALPGRSANAIKNRWCWLARHHPAELAKEGFPQNALEMSEPNRPCESAETLGAFGQGGAGIGESDAFWMEQPELFWE
jgi:hypothetical protein